MRIPSSSIAILVLSILISTTSSLYGASALASVDCENQFVKAAKKTESRLEVAHVRLDGRAVYYEHLPAKRGKPTVFLLNGMFVPRESLQAFREAFEARSKGEGLLIMYYSTQLESLYLRGALGEDPALNLKLPEGRTLTRKDFAIEAAAVLQASGAKGAIYLAGYSFGAGPAVEFASLLGNQSMGGARVKETRGRQAGHVF
jgi:hypothetical protein